MNTFPGPNRDLEFSRQAKLLRVLQERQVVRLGSRTPVAIDVRVVAATNVNLGYRLACSQDLYYRLQVATLDIPALHERPGYFSVGKAFSGYIRSAFRSEIDR